LKRNKGMSEQHNYLPLLLSSVLLKLSVVFYHTIKNNTTVTKHTD